MVKVLDNYYFKEMDGQELKEKIDKACTTLLNVESMAQVEDIMAEE